MMALASAGLRAAGNTALAAPLSTHERTFPARPDQVREARLFMAGILAGGPLADDAVLCVSELASNCVLHSASGRQSGTFAVRAQVRDGHVWLTVVDDADPWGEPTRDGRAHGLDIVRELASEVGIGGDALTGRAVWARLDGPARRPWARLR